MKSIATAIAAMIAMGDQAKLDSHRSATLLHWSGLVKPSPWNQSPGQGRLIQSCNRNTHGLYIDGPGKG